jgi:hypothetical protein
VAVAAELLHAEADGLIGLLFRSLRSYRFAPREIPIVKSYRVSFANVRALIVRVIQESIVFFRRCGARHVGTAKAPRSE